MINGTVQTAGMTSAARLLTAFLGVALIVTAWLPWTGAATALAIPSATLWDPARAALSSTYLSSVALLLWVAGALVVLGAVMGSRALAIAGGLLGAGSGIAWVLSNAVSRSANAVDPSSIRAGAYLAIAAGLAVLLVAALSRDTSHPTAR